MKKTKFITFPRIVCAIIISCCISNILLSGVLAKYVISEESDPLTKRITDFDVNTLMYFIDPVSGKQEQAVFDPMYTNFVSINLHDETAKNYIDNFRCDVFYRGETPFYLRVIIESFIVEIVDGTFLDMDMRVFKMNTYDENLALTEKDQNSWYDNTDKDSAFYWTNYLTTVNAADPQAYERMSLLEGKRDAFDPNDHENQLIYITIRAEAIQINRYNAFWNMRELPWREE